MSEHKGGSADPTVSSAESDGASREDQHARVMQHIAGAFTETGSVTLAALLHLPG